MFRFAQHDRLLAFVRWLLEFGFESKRKKSWLEIVSEPAPRHPCPHIKLLMVVVMIPMVAVIAVPAVPIVRPIIAIVPIGSVVSVRVIAIAISVVIAIPRITNPDSD